MIDMKTLNINEVGKHWSETLTPSTDLYLSFEAALNPEVYEAIKHRWQPNMTGIVIAKKPPTLKLTRQEYLDLYESQMLDK